LYLVQNTGFKRITSYSTTTETESRHTRGRRCRSTTRFCPRFTRLFRWQFGG